MEMQVKTRYYFIRISISKIKVLVRIWSSWNACALLAWISNGEVTMENGIMVQKNVSHSVMSDLAIPWTVAHQVPLSRQEYWSGLPFPSLGDLLNPGIEPGMTQQYHF